MAISKDDFLYLQSIGVPYEGDVLGLGTISTKMINTVSNSPSCGAVAQGYFYNPNYLSVIIPGTFSKTPQDGDRETEKGIRDYLTREGVYTDPITGERYPLSDRTNLTVNVSDDNVEIIFKNDTSRIRHNMKLEELRSMVENPARSGKIITISSGEYSIPDIDYAKASETSRRISGYFMTIASPFYEGKTKIQKYNLSNPNGYTHIRLKKEIWGYDIFKYLDGINMKNSTVLKAEKVFRWGGRTIGIGALLVGGVDVIKNEPNYANVTHLTVAAIGMIPNSYTTGFATAFFIADGLLIAFTDKGLVEYIREGFSRPVPTRLPMREFIDSRIILEDYVRSYDFGHNQTF